KEVGFAAARGIAHDRDGAWIIGYNRFLSNCPVFDTESWDILDELSLLIERGYDKVLIQSDCLEAVIAIQTNSLERSNSALISRIHQMLSRFKQLNIRHTFREDNKETDRLNLLLFEISPLEGIV
ncbi:hypothetical protein Gohar_007399, partial [Gossypium harknessii]|nr:hypothetical protein [Gossypium harknessii]